MTKIVKFCANPECGKRLVLDWKTRKHEYFYCNRECCQRHRFLKIHELFLQGKISHRHTLRNHLLYVRGYKCEICGLTEWLGQPIPLILDHKDGNWQNDFPENLQLVCGNCDMQLPTYKAKNKGRGRPYRRIAPVTQSAE